MGQNYFIFNLQLKYVDDNGWAKDKCILRGGRQMINRLTHLLNNITFCYNKRYWQSRWQSRILGDHSAILPVASIEFMPSEYINM